MNKVIHGDCLIESEQIASGSVDLILTDPPYGTMRTTGLEITQNKRIEGRHEWDEVINPVDIYNIANRILRKNGKMVLFGNEPYTTKLINEAIPNVPFSYRAIWEKDNYAMSLGCKRAMVGYYEDILVFSKTYDVKYVTPNNPSFEYFRECKANSGLTTQQFNHLYCDYVGKKKNRQRGMVARCWETSQFWFPSKEIYENVMQPTGYFPIAYSDIKKVNDEFNTKYLSTFNLWEGKKYKSNILKYPKDYDGFHPTQKPVALLEDLIKTFSNEGDLIVDLTAGSGSTAVACNNTGRNYIMIEKEQKYIDIINKRIAEHEQQQTIFKGVQ